ncbi:MAG: hypothetical protein EXR71_11540 [Myxococcales bacterium]|nr:hypothetical protein [Myxococcales bacterium]
MNAPVVDALDVIARLLAWLSRNGGRNLSRARFIEETLSPWAVRLMSIEAEAVLDDVVAIRVALAGFDDADDRLQRVEAMYVAYERVRAHVGDGVPPVGEARAVLLPEGVATETHPRVVTVEFIPAPAIEFSVGAAGRPPQRREGRDGRDRAGDRPPRERPTGRAGDVAPREPNSDARLEDVARPPPPPVPPAVPPPPPTFPLGHPEGSGVSVTALGATAAEVEALAAIDVATVAELILIAPTGHRRAGERLVDGVEPEGPVLVRGRMARRCTHLSSGAARFDLLLVTERGELRCLWFGAVPPEVLLSPPGGNIGLSGRCERGDDGVILYEGEPLGIDGRGGDWLPEYGVPGVADPRLRELMRAALRSVDELLAEHLPAEVVERQKLPQLGAALRDAHFPSNVHRKGWSRLAFDELFQVQLGMALLRAPERRERGVAHVLSHGLVGRGLAQTHAQFEDAQESAFDAIRRDLRRSAPMERLVQGDVGSGKGAVVRAAMTMVAAEKQAVLYCASDALAAEHHHLFAADWWRSVGIEPLLLLGSPSRAEAEALRKGETLVVYGTHGLLERPPELKKLGLVVVEQSGTYAMPDLAQFETGPRPDLLVVTPTPVPALIAMTVYGQLAMSVIDKPPMHGVDTHVLDVGQRAEAYAAAREALGAGRQVLLVFPFQEGRRDLLSPSEARRMAEVLTAQQLPGARIVLFSGGLTPEERFRAYEDFQHRRADVLLATTAFEEGPIVPNASIIIAEYAEGFDLVRLHRLRNHVAHGWARGACYFVQGEGTTAAARNRLDLVAHQDDGFRIADLDLAARGVSAALGDAADVPRFAWADPAHDRETLTRARSEAFRLLGLDPGLRRRQHRPLVNLVRARFGEEPFTQDGAPPPPPTGDPSSKRRRRRRR